LHHSTPPAGAAGSHPHILAVPAASADFSDTRKLRASPLRAPIRVVTQDEIIVEWSSESEATILRFAAGA
jgi:hypothetical protein